MIGDAAVHVRACAKVNLTLRVLGIRADGYHELRTTFQSLAMHDTLTFTPVRGPLTITSTDPDCPTDESNLVWKAAARLREAAGRRGTPSGVHVHIHKRIPVQSGLGGGSSDAAAALRALRLLWNLRIDDGDLETIGRELGADVAFFLEGGTVLGVERGDLLFPLQDVARTWVVLARPDFGVSTKEAYGWWDEAHLARERARGRRSTRIASRVDLRAREWMNDLQAPVVSRHPGILRLVRRLERLGAGSAMMSGSGSAVFGLFDTAQYAEAAAASVEGRGLDVWVTRTLSRREYLRATRPRIARRLSR